MDIHRRDCSTAVPDKLGKLWVVTQANRDEYVKWDADRLTRVLTLERQEEEIKQRARAARQKIREEEAEQREADAQAQKHALELADRRLAAELAKKEVEPVSFEGIAAALMQSTRNPSPAPQAARLLASDVFQPSMMDVVMRLMDSVARPGQAAAGPGGAPVPARDQQVRVWEPEVAPLEDQNLHMESLFPPEVTQYSTPLVDELGVLPFRPAIIAEVLQRSANLPYQRKRLYFSAALSAGLFSLWLGGLETVMVLKTHSLEPSRYDHPPGEELENDDTAKYEVLLYGIRNRPATIVLEGTLSEMPQDGLGGCYDGYLEREISRVFVDSTSFLR